MHRTMRFLLALTLVTFAPETSAIDWLVPSGSPLRPTL
jgi:hypothetical protein